MTHCHNCGHAGTFVLLVQFALAIPDADTSPSAEDSDAAEFGPSPGEYSLAVQCPACDSTDVDAAADDLLTRYRSSTTS